MIRSERLDGSWDGYQYVLLNTYVRFRGGIERIWDEERRSKEEGREVNT